MGLFDNIEGNLDAIADEVGITPDQVKAITNSVQANLTSSEGNPAAALEATAAQHGVSVETIQEILNHGGGLESELGDFAGSLFKAGQ
jgi:chorismate mutase